MKTCRLTLAVLLSVFVLTSCGREKVDDQKPVIDLDINGAFPVNCDTLYFGESITFTARFTDNVELGAFSIDVHNNFDHHTHSTEVTECELSPVKDPVNPWHFIQDFSIPEGLTEYRADVAISVPSGNNDGEFDTGDYHFFISLSDREGWSAQKGLSIKILKRQ